MPRPEILSYYSGERNFRDDAAIGGHVLISRGPTKPENALVYALVPAGLEDEFPLTGSEETLLGRPVLPATRAEDRQGDAADDSSCDPMHRIPPDPTMAGRLRSRRHQGTPPASALTCESAPGGSPRRTCS